MPELSTTDTEALQNFTASLQNLFTNYETIHAFAPEPSEKISLEDLAMISHIFDEIQIIGLNKTEQE